jgi:hypothetical protein
LTSLWASVLVLALVLASVLVSVLAMIVSAVVVTLPATATDPPALTRGGPPQADLLL